MIYDIKKERTIDDSVFIKSLAFITKTKLDYKSSVEDALLKLTFTEGKLSLPLHSDFSNCMVIRESFNPVAAFSVAAASNFTTFARSKMFSKLADYSSDNMLFILLDKDFKVGNNLFVISNNLKLKKHVCNFNDTFVSSLIKYSINPETQEKENVYMRQLISMKSFVYEENTG